MFFTQKNYNIIITLLQTHRELSAKKLHFFINDIGEKISLVHTYNIINELVSLHVLTKKGKKITLNQRRLSRIRAFINHTQTVDKKEREIKKDKNDDKKVKKEEEEKNQYTYSKTTYYSYKSHSLIELDSIWTTVYADIIKETNPNEIFFYTSHSYHILGLPDSESAFLNRGSQGKKAHYVVGNKSFLDEYAISMLQARNLTSIITIDQDIFLQKGYVLDIVGDYCIELLLPNALSSYLDRYFDYVKTWDQFDPEKFRGIFSMKSPLELKIYKSQEKAKLFKQLVKKLL